MSIGLKGNVDGSGAVQVGGSDAITISTGLVVTLNGGAVYPLTSGTAVTASGTSIDFTGIPATAKRVTVMLSGVSTSGTSPVICRIGDSVGIATSGYVGNLTTLSNAAAVSVQDSTNSLAMSNTTSAANIHVGKSVWENLDGNTWVGNSQCRAATTVTTLGSATLTLSGALTQLRVTTTNGTDTFDAGTVNITWE